MKRRGAQAGSVLVVALGSLAMLAVMATGIRTALFTETRLIRYRRAQMHAMSWARAGVYLALQRLAEDANQPEREDWLGDDWAVIEARDAAARAAWEVMMPVIHEDPTALDGVIRIEVIDEDRKLDLNTAGAHELERLLGDAELARIILAHRTPRPIHALEELWDLPEMSRQDEARRVMLEHGTVWTRGMVNLNTVQREVLAALVPDPALVDRLVESRPGPDGAWGTADDCKATAVSTAPTELASCAVIDAQALVSVLTHPGWRVSSSVFRIRAEGHVTRPAVRYRIDAVVRRGGSADPAASMIRMAAQSFQIVEWREG